MVLPRTTDNSKDRVSVRDFKKPITNKQKLIEVLKKVGTSRLNSKSSTQSLPQVSRPK